MRLENGKVRIWVFSGRNESGDSSFFLSEEEPTKKWMQDTLFECWGGSADSWDEEYYGELPKLYHQWDKKSRSGSFSMDGVAYFKYYETDVG